MTSGQGQVVVRAEGGRDGLHHLVGAGDYVVPHDGPDVRSLVIRTGVDPADVRPDRRCPACWEAFGDERVDDSVRDRLASLARQQSLRRRWPGRLRRAR